MQTEAQRLSSGEKLIRILMITMTLSSMSALMFNIVLPRISEEFKLSLAQTSWLSTGYTLIYAVGTVTYGKLADRFNLKSLLTFGVTLFVIGSLIGLASQSFWMALAGRCIQSAGAAAIPATAVLIPVRYFAPERRGYALGMTAVGLAIGSALGPLVSTMIVSFAHWRWLFCVPMLLLFTLPYYRKYLDDESGSSSGKFDWVGGSALAVTATLLLLGVTNGSWEYFAGGVAAGAVFLVRIRHAADPFVQSAMFRNRGYTIGILMALLITGISVSLYFLSPILLSRVYDLPPSLIGFAMVPAAAASAFLGRKGGKLADAKGNSTLFYTASGSLILGFTLLSSFTGISPYLVAIFLIFGNVGQSFMQIAMTNSISRTLPKDRIGVGMGLFSMLNFMSQGMATAIYGRVADAHATIPWNPLNGANGSAVFSNIYLVLAALHLGLLTFYVLNSGNKRNLA